jgi:hypothetical protein
VSSGIVFILALSSDAAVQGGSEGRAVPALLHNGRERLIYECRVIGCAANTYARDGMSPNRLQSG